MARSRASAFGTADDASAGGGSVIKALSARSADDASVFESDAFGKSIRLPKPVKMAADPRFRVI